MKKIIFIVLFFVCTISYTFVSAQTVTGGLTGTDLATIITGPGVNITNVVLTCPDGASGSFSDGNLSNIGVDAGVLLTTGNISQAFGANTDGMSSDDNGGGGDVDLTAASGFTTFNACVLEFDFTPSANNLEVDFVFASEEYNEYVCSEFNDVFGFFVSGLIPGGGGAEYTNEDIALVPGVGSPITINTINNGSAGSEADGSPCDLGNSAFYNDNTGGATVQWDGFTTVLTASLALVPCEEYHFKFAIADASDAILDSGVFLEAASFQTNNIVATATDSPEGCPGGEITFTSTLPNITGYTIDITVLGSSTASPSDYEPFLLNYFLPIGQQVLTVPIVSIADVLDEGNESIDFEFTYDAGCDPTTDNASIDIIDGPITCNDFLLLIGPPGTGSITADDVLTGDLNAACPSFLISLSKEDFVCNDEGLNVVTVTADDGNGNISQCQSNVTVQVLHPILDIDLGDDCRPVYLGYEPLECTDITATVAGGTPPYTYNWSNGENTQTITVCPVVTSFYDVTVTDSNGCEDVSLTVEVEVIDVRCGNKLKKVLVCHIPPGNPANEHNICISPNAVPTHLSALHGDYLGVCGEFPCDGMLPAPKQAEINDMTIEDEAQLSIFPNPTSSGIKFDVGGLEVRSVEVIQASGDVVMRETSTSVKANMHSLDAVSNLAPGIYFLRVSTVSGEVLLKRFVKL